MSSTQTSFDGSDKDEEVVQTQPRDDVCDKKYLHLLLEQISVELTIIELWLLKFCKLVWSS